MAILMKHEGRTYASQTVHVSGKAFIGCMFEDCTLELMNLPVAFERCTFRHCSWHLNYYLATGDAGARQALRTILDCIDQEGQLGVSPN
jgi:hypothetical protein